MWLDQTCSIIKLRSKIILYNSNNWFIQNYTVEKMFHTAEDFFISIGLSPMTDTFWEKSVFQKIPNRKMVCHASAWSFQKTDDFRWEFVFCRNVLIQIYFSLYDIDIEIIIHIYTMIRKYQETDFFDYQGLVHNEYLLAGQTINKEYWSVWEKKYIKAPPNCTELFDWISSKHHRASTVYIWYGTGRTFFVSQVEVATSWKNILGDRKNQREREGTEGHLFFFLP